MGQSAGNRKLKKALAGRKRMRIGVQTGEIEIIAVTGQLLKLVLLSRYPVAADAGNGITVCLIWECRRSNSQFRLWIRIVAVLLRTLS